MAPFHTTDYFLSTLLGAPGGSERLIHVFSALPAKAPVAVVIPKAQWGSMLTAYILAYFGWPREVRLIEVTRENVNNRLQALDQTQLAAIFFCGVSPAATSQPGIRLGTNLVVMPTAATQ